MSDQRASRPLRLAFYGDDFTGSTDALEVLAFSGLRCALFLSVPTPDHYLPLLYVISLLQEGESISFPVQGFDGGSVSMLAVRIG